MVVPTPAKGPVTNPAAKPVAKPTLKPPTASAARPPVKPITKPPATAARLSVKPIAKPPAREPRSPLPTPSSPLPAPRSLPPNLLREPGMVAVPLPPVEQSKRAAMPSDQAAVVRRRIAGFAFSSWLRKLWPSAQRHLPADTTIPGKAERRIALQLAAVLAAAALVSLLPVIVGHANLFVAPPWALAAVLMAVLQLVYAVWMINAPDWAAAWVQMVVCAIITTIYGMLMTLTMIASVNQPLILDLGEVRRAAPAWCGLMFVLMGAATWFSGRTSVRWRRSLMPQSEK